MTATVDEVRPIAIDEIRQARQRISRYITRTPLFRLELGADFPVALLKLENLQPTNSYKIRGALNAVAMLADDARARGVWTISAGNAGQGVAYAAREAGVPCTVVAIETAPKAKLHRMEALGASLILVSYDQAWKALESRQFAGLDGTFIHPFDDHNFIAGHATLGLEILEDAPDAAVVVAAVGGGGLTVGIGSTVKALKPNMRVIGVEPETAAPATLSFRMGSPQRFADWRASFVDGAGGKSLFPRMWERMRYVVDDCLCIGLDEVKGAIRLMAEQARVISEGAGALPLAAVLSRKVEDGPVVAVVSGGNIDLTRFSSLIEAGG